MPRILEQLNSFSTTTEFSDVPRHTRMAYYAIFLSLFPVEDIEIIIPGDPNDLNLERKREI